MARKPPPEVKRSVIRRHERTERVIIPIAEVERLIAIHWAQDRPENSTLSFQWGIDRDGPPDDDEVVMVIHSVEEN